jgi:hypothetical protein
LDLITNLWNSWELDLHFKNTKKNILFIPISSIVNLYIKHIPDIKDAQICFDFRMTKFDS